MRRRIGAIYAAAVLFAASCTNDQPTELTSSGPTPRPLAATKQKQEKIPNRYIVRLRDDVRDVGPKATAIASVHGGTVRKIYTHAIKGFSLQIPDAAVAALARHPEVLYVEQDQTVHLVAEQANAPWGLDRVDQRDLPLSTTYEYNATGDGVDVYIIDTGIRTTHTEFGGRAIGGVDMIGDGWGSEDCHGHGTHVAGIVGGANYGVAKNVRLIAVRVLDCGGGGTYEGVIAGIDWVTFDHQAGQPAVANMSLAGGHLQALDDAVTNSTNSGVVHVVAAANGYYDACAYSPASTPAALTVGATDAGDTEAEFSNRGSCLDIWAPGVDVTSAFNYDDNATETLSGTSMASPHVAGAAALYLQGHRAATAADVDDALSANATTGKIAWNDPYGDKPLPPPAGQDFLLYTGFIGATPPPAPAAPTNLTAVASTYSSVHLEWQDNSTNENAFRIERCRDAAAPAAPCADFAQVALIGQNQRGYDDNGLSGTATYRYRVRAYNSGGNSDYSNAADATTPESPPPPVAPSELVANAVSFEEVDLTWIDNSTNEYFFIIERCQDAGAPCTDFQEYAYISPDETQFQDYSVVQSSTYRYRLAAYGEGGRSAYAEAVATTPTPPPPPDAPSGLTATAVSYSQIDLSWADNSTNEVGFAIERCDGAGCTNFGYYAQVGPGVTTFSNSGLVWNATYRYRVYAFHGNGASAYSNEASATTLPPPPPPKAPSGLTATAGSTSRIDLSWVDNSNDEDAFVVESCAGAGCTAFAQIARLAAGVTTYSHSGLSSNSTHRYRVYAFKPYGNSGYSNTVDGMTANVPPVAHYAWNCRNGSCTFTSNSSDIDGMIVSYAWKFGDGTSGTGAPTSHTYKRAGTFQVVLTVTDDRLGTGTVSCSVDASNGKTKVGSC
jgi:subtilisin family serine protease